MSIRGFDTRQIITPGAFNDFVGGRVSPYHLLGSLREDVFVDEARKIRPTILLGTGNAHTAVGRVMTRGDGPKVRQTLASLLSEAQMQQNICHPGIASLYAVLDFPDDGLCMTLREHIKGESLQQMILGKGGRLPANVVSWVVYGILQTVEYLQVKGHSGQPISHGGITPNNVILSSDGVKLTDFSLAKIVGSGFNTFQPTGSSDYRAPEQNIGDPQMGTDVWGAGLTGIVALLGYVPDQIKEMYMRTLSYKLPDGSAPEHLKGLLERMMLKDYDERPSATEALDHMVRHGLVEHGLGEDVGLADKIEKGLRGFLGRKPKRRSTEEIQLSRHLRLARDYARMRDKTKMESEIESAGYNARLAGKDIVEQVQGTYRILDNSTVDYGKQLIRNIVIIDDHSLPGLKAEQNHSGNEFLEVYGWLKHCVNAAITREVSQGNLELNPQRSARIDQYFKEYLAAEAESYIQGQLKFIRELDDVDHASLIGVLQRYKRLAAATGAKWDDESAMKLFKVRVC